MILNKMAACDFKQNGGPVCEIFSISSSFMELTNDPLQPGTGNFKKT